MWWSVQWMATVRRRAGMVRLVTVTKMVWELLRSDSIIFSPPHTHRLTDCTRLSARVNEQVSDSAHFHASEKSSEPPHELTTHDSCLDQHS